MPKEHMKKDSNFSSPENWKSFQMLGLDVEIHGKEMIHEMLDELINGVEKSSQVDQLNVNVSEGIVPKSYGILSELRHLVADLIIDNVSDLSILDQLFNLTLLAVEQCFGTNPKPALNLYRIKDSRLVQTQSVLILLQFLRFDFQPYGCTDQPEDLDYPIVIWPHWDKNGLLKPALEVFRNLILLKDNAVALEEIVAVLRMSLKSEHSRLNGGKGVLFLDANSGMSESLDGDVADIVDMVSLLIDVLSLSEHAPQIQLMITDSGVRKVWNCSPCRRLLAAIGFHQVGLALMSYRNLANARYQQSVLRILCALSGVKGEAMVGRVDAKFLGVSLETGSAQVTRTEDPKLIYRGGSVISATDNVHTATGSIDIHAGILSDHQNTLSIMGPTSNIHIPIQWRVNVKNFTENGENVVQLAEQLRNVKLEYKQQLEAVKRQHRIYLEAHSNIHLDETFGIVPVRSERVNVAPGGTPSTTLRKQLQPPPHVIPTLEQVANERDYSQYLLQWRVSDIKNYERSDLKSLILNSCNAIAEM